MAKSKGKTPEEWEIFWKNISKQVEKARNPDIISKVVDLDAGFHKTVRLWNKRTGKFED